MEKHESKIIYEQLKDMLSEGDIDGALDIVDEVNWRKVHNVNTLVAAADVLKKGGRYEDAREILYIAYDKSPIARSVMYNLGIINVLLGDIEEAERFYKEFMEIAPHDSIHYVLQYKIAQAKGENITSLIRILEELKSKDFLEEWAFELACLYHTAMMADKCVELCDEIILWFGEGPYVEKALELKMLYSPLDNQQKTLYDEIVNDRSDSLEEESGEYLRSGEIVARTLEIPTVDISEEKFNTINLQAEIKKNIDEIMRATETSAVSENIENIKSLVDELPYLSDEAMNIEIAKKRQEANEQIDNMLRNELESLLTEGEGGQLSLNIEATDEPEPQVEGQLTLEDLLKQWEDSQSAAKEVLETVEAKRLETEKSIALMEANEIMGKLEDVIPGKFVIPKIVDGQESLEGFEIPIVKKNDGSGEDSIDYTKATELVAGMNNVLQDEIDKLIGEGVTLEDNALLGSSYMDEGLPELKLARDLKLDQIHEPAHEEALEQEQEEVLEPEQEPKQEETLESETWPSQEDDTEPESEEEQEVETEPEQESEPEIEYESEMEEVSQNTMSFESLFDSDGQLIQNQQEELEYDNELESEDEYDTNPDESQDFSSYGMTEPESTESVDAFWLENNEETEETEETESDIDITAATVRLSKEDIAKLVQESIGQTVEKEVIKVGLSPEEKRVFASFLPISGFESQIARVISGLMNTEGYSQRNVVVCGEVTDGLTELSSNILKAVSLSTDLDLSLVGKISGDSLNSKDIDAIFDKVNGGSLMIENCLGIEEGTIERLIIKMLDMSNNAIIILQDSRKDVEKLFATYPRFGQMFTNKITVPVMTIDELVNYGKVYAFGKRCVIDEVAVLALYNRINLLQAGDETTTMSDVAEVVDEAIKSAEGGDGLLKMFKRPKHDEDGYLIIGEKDFEL